MYIWQQTDWPWWRYDLAALQPLLAQVHQGQGHLQGRLHDVGWAVQEQAMLQVLSQDVLKTSEIEGELLNPQSVRSSLARRLGVDIGALVPADRHVEGVVDMVMDATRNFAQPLTAQRIMGWQAALFPTGYSGLMPVQVGRWRDDAQGPMQVVSGPMHRQTVHYEAPPAAQLAQQVEYFLQWFNAQGQVLDPVIKAGLAHLWFITLHPFDDGNGRVARAVADMALARAEGSSLRCYSLSAQIQQERKDYYDWLERTQKGGMDVTAWLQWFVGCLLRAIERAGEVVSAVLTKARFWQTTGAVAINERQVKVINRMLDGFEGKLTSSKWAALAKCSQDTAQRDIADLITKGVLLKSAASGRATSYEVVGLGAADQCRAG